MATFKGSGRSLASRTRQNNPSMWMWTLPDTFPPRQSWCCSRLNAHTKSNTSRRMKRGSLREVQNLLYFSHPHTWLMTTFPRNCQKWTMYTLMVCWQRTQLLGNAAQTMLLQTNSHFYYNLVVLMCCLDDRSCVNSMSVWTLQTHPKITALV